MAKNEIFCQSALTPNGWLSPAKISIDESGVISGVSTPDQHEAHKLLRGPVLPGMPNLHSHAFQRQMAGLTETASGLEDSFWTWREAMYGLAERISPSQLQSIAAYLQAEMLEAGFTSCAEFHYVHHQPGGQPYDDLAEMSRSLITAAESSGIALTLLPVLYCRSGFSADAVSDRQKRFYNSPDRYLRLIECCEQLVSGHALHHLGIAPHSLRAVSRDQLEGVLTGRPESSSPVHIHVAEQPAEVQESQSVLGCSPVDWLMENFAIDSRWCLVHATHMSKDELERAAASGAVAGLCPITEADLGDGFFPAEAWLTAGGKFGIGSDSNLRVSVPEELRWLEFGCRLRTGGRNVLAEKGKSCGGSIYQQALTGGAQAVAQNVGKIEKGYRADLLELDSSHPLLENRVGDAIIDTWVFAGGSEMLRSVWVAGELRVEQGRHVSRTSLQESFRQTMKELT